MNRLGPRMRALAAIHPPDSVALCRLVREQKSQQAAPGFSLTGPDSRHSVSAVYGGTGTQLSSDFFAGISACWWHLTDSTRKLVDILRRLLCTVIPRVLANFMLIYGSYYRFIIGVSLLVFGCFERTKRNFAPGRLSGSIYRRCFGLTVICPVKKGLKCGTGGGCSNVWLISYSRCLIAYFRTMLRDIGRISNTSGPLILNILLPTLVCSPEVPTVQMWQFLRIIRLFLCCLFALHEALF